MVAFSSWPGRTKAKLGRHVPMSGMCSSSIQHIIIHAEKRAGKRTWKRTVSRALALDLGRNARFGRRGSGSGRFVVRAFGVARRHCNGYGVWVLQRELCSKGRNHGGETRSRSAVEIPGDG